MEDNNHAITRLSSGALDDFSIPEVIYWLLYDKLTLTDEIYRLLDDSAKPIIFRPYEFLYKMEIGNIYSSINSSPDFSFSDVLIKYNRRFKRMLMRGFSKDDPLSNLPECIREIIFDYSYFKVYGYFKGIDYGMYDMLVFSGHGPGPTGLRYLT